MIDVPPTDALRRRSPELLRAALLSLVVDRAAVWALDTRDLLVAMAPYHHCAGALGVSVPELFGEVAAEGPVSLAELVREFGLRSDVTPSAFGFELVTLEDGPAYVWPDLGPGKGDEVLRCFHEPG